MLIKASSKSIKISMSEKYHEILQPAKEILMGWGARILDLVVPEGALDLPQASPADVVERTYSAMTAPFEDMQEE